VLVSFDQLLKRPTIAALRTLDELSVRIIHA